MPIDPICGMEVDESSAVTAERDGKTYYFCCVHCRAKFLDPEAAKKKAAAAKSANRFICPMCPGVESDHPGACPKCGMALEPDQPVTRKRITVYTCPMHPEIERNERGACPKCGMELEPKQIDAGEQEGDPELRSMTLRFWVALALSVPILLLAMLPMVGVRLHSWIPVHIAQWLQFALSTPVVLWAGWPFFQRGWNSVVSRNLNMFTLIALGTGTAYLFSTAALLFPAWIPDAFKENEQVHVYFESAAIIITLVLLGQVLELRARRRTGSAVRELLELAPPVAYVVENGTEKEVPLEEVKKGDILRIRPGGKIAVDGEVIEGKSTVVEAMITGEPDPVEKTAGAKVIGGTVNESGSFLMRAEKVGDDTVLAQIVALVANAQRSRAPIQRVADAVAGWFVPAVVLSAVITFFVWAVFQPKQPALAYALVNAVAVLIVACPCALGLATPMSIMVGIGRGAREGILVKDAEAIEILEKIDTIVLDKTGTLTEGKPKLTDCLPSSRLRQKAGVPFSGEGGDLFSEDDLLRLAASIEQNSEHPLARAIVENARDQNLELTSADEFHSTPGGGVRGRVGDRSVVVGNANWLQTNQISDFSHVAKKADELQQKGRTVVHVGVDGKFAGLLAIADPVKPSTPEALNELHQMGLRIVMLTGDSEKTAKAVADELNIDEFQAGVTPGQKNERIEQLRSQGRRVAMAGDGINDAPALAAAHVGIAMGTGADVAIEAAGVTLVKGDLRGLVRAFRLSRRVMANIRQNLFFAFIYNILGIPIAAGILAPLGLLLNPMIAAAAMSFSSVSVISNALRLRTQRIAG